MYPPERIGRQIFAFSDVGAVPSDSVVNVYCSAAIKDAEVVINALKPRLREGLPPSLINLIAPHPAGGGLPDMLRSSQKLDQMVAEETGFSRPSRVKVIGVNARGEPKYSGGPVASEDWRKILDTGLLQIFRDRRGFLEAAHNFHYISPSGRHTTKFMRIGNLLLRGIETEFLALGLLPFVPDDTLHIYTDTATINAVAYAVSELRRRLGVADFAASAIDSFSCWSRGETFNWEEPARSICLISASTSGNLEQRVRSETEVRHDRIITLFYGGTSKPDGPVLCDLTRASGAGDYERVPTNYDNESECQLCRDGVMAVRISGDQFLPARPVVKEILIQADHAPRWFRDALPALVGQQIISCFCGHANSDSDVRPMSFDFDNAVRNEDKSPFRKQVDLVLRTLVPANLSCIIYIDEQGSRALADHIRDLYQERTSRSLEEEQLVASSQLFTEGRSCLSAKAMEGTVLIITGSSTTGRELLAVSQTMRGMGETETDPPLAYFTGLARLPARARWTQLRTNLAFGLGPDQHPVQAAFVIELPEDRDIIEAWTSEQALLRHLAEKSELAADQREAVNKRLECLLSAAKGPTGLVNDAFLPRPNGEPLPLRKGFVFFRDYPDMWDIASQADVYFTMAAILHGLRLRTDGEESLRQFEHTSRVLAPANYARFSDGVIQAALLRAATPVELNYHMDERLSAQMCDILVQYAHRQEASEEGEGLVEFLLAVACERLTLVPKHLTTFLEKLEPLSSRIPLMGALAIAAHEIVTHETERRPIAHR